MELVLNSLAVIAAGMIAYFYLTVMRRLKYTCLIAENDFIVFTRTAAFDAFLSFITELVLTACALVRVLRSISNHSVVTLDILYISSLLILVLYHLLKVSQVLL